MKIGEVQGEMKKGEHRIVAMLDGKVHMRLHPVEFVMEPENAEAAGKAMLFAARIAKLVQRELDHIPKEHHSDAQVREYMTRRMSEIEIEMGS